MAAENVEIKERWEEFYRRYYKNEIGKIAQGEKESLAIDYADVEQYDPDLADDLSLHPEEFRDAAEDALGDFDIAADVSLESARVRFSNFRPKTGIREIRSDDVNKLIAVEGIVRKATEVRPKVLDAAFECQRCGTLTNVEQTGQEFSEPHQCRGCERQGPFRLLEDQSQFVDAQKLRVQESPEGLRGGQTPQKIDVNIEGDITGVVSPGDRVTATGVLRAIPDDGSTTFEVFIEGINVEIEDQDFEDFEITEDDEEAIREIAASPNLYEKILDSIAPSIYGYDEEKLAMVLQLFSGVTKELPDGTRIRGDMHILLVGDPGTAKSQLLQYAQKISPRGIYTSGKGATSAGLTAAAVQDDFGDGKWTLEAGALVLADKGIACVDEVDKMRCVTGDTLVSLGNGSLKRIREIAREAANDTDAGIDVEELPNGRTLRAADTGTEPITTVRTMTDDGRIVRRPVTAIHEYDAPDELVGVELETGERLTTTADHPFFVFEDGDRVKKPAESLEEADWTYVPRALGLERATDGGGRVARVSASAGTEYKDSRGNVTDEDAALGAVLGYLSGDGNIYYERGGGSYGARFTNTEEELLSDFERVCRLAFGAEPVRHPSEKRGNVVTVRLHGKEYADSVLEAGMNLENYDGKALPSAVAEGSYGMKTAFVRALADSEGCVDASAGNVRISSSSYDLLLGAKSILLEFGVSSQIQKRERDDGRDLHSLNITDADSLSAYARHVGFELGRKQNALERVVDDASGDRTILDVIPEIGDVLRDIRTRLRLRQVDCGIEKTTYGDFERGKANISVHRARRVLGAFENRKREAEEDFKKLGSPCPWETLEELRRRYRVSQSEVAEGTRFIQQSVSRGWGEDEELRETVRRRLREIVEEAAGTDISELSRLVDADAKWRRVKTVERVPAEEADDRVPVLRERLADVLGCPTDEAEVRARRILENEYDCPCGSWETLRYELERHSISFAQLSEELGVSDATVSRWFNGVVEKDPECFDEVRQTASLLVREKRFEVRRLLDEIESRKIPKVYDLTVEGTHNFVANGMIVHNSEDRSALHEALEQQQVSIAKAGINATLKSRCSLLGAANPKYGRFDEYEGIAEQIDLEPALISRFDLIFTVTDNPDEDEDSNIAQHILQTNYAGEIAASGEDPGDETHDIEPDIDPELLRKYIAYARRECRPTMTDEARQRIEDFYVDLRAQGGDGEAVPVTARKLEALVRLAEASARMRISDKVEVRDAERAIDVTTASLDQVGRDPETGEFDIDVIESGTSQSQRDRIKGIKEIIETISNESDDGKAPMDEIIELAEEHGMEPEKAHNEIDSLRRRGELIEPETDHFRLV